MDVRAFLASVDDLVAETSRLLEVARGLQAPTDVDEVDAQVAVLAELEDSAPSPTWSTSSTSSSTGLDLDDAEARMFRGQLVFVDEQAALKEAGRWLEGVDLARARLLAGTKLSPADLELLGLPDVKREDLATRGSDLDASEALSRLGSHATVSPNTDSSTPSSDSRPTNLRRLGRMEPKLAAKVAKALFKMGLADAEEAHADVGERMRELAAVDRAKANLDAARERLKQRLTRKDDVASHLYESNLYDSTEALKASKTTLPGSDTDRFQSQHHGELRKYNVGDDASGAALNTPTEDATFRAMRGQEVTQVVTTALTPEERASKKLSGGPDGLRRADGSAHDTRDAQAFISFDGVTLPKEMFVLTEDDEILAASQVDLSRNVLAFREAQDALEEKTGRRIPKDVEEARAFGFPEKASIGHHTSFLGGGEVKSAGEIVTRDGKVQQVSNASGHYMPHAESTFRAVEVLERMGAIVHGLGENATQVVVHVPHPDPSQKTTIVQSFPAVLVLASGGDLARAQLLQAELARRGEGVPPEGKAFEATVRRHEQQARKRREKLAKGLLAEQARQLGQLRELDRAAAALAKELGADGADRAAIEQRLAEVEAQHDAVETALAATRERIAEKVAKLDVALDALRDELLSAGASPSAVEKILYPQRRGIGALNEAQLDFVLWMEDFGQRRKELAALKKLAASKDFRDRKADARAALERLFGAS